MAEEKPRASSTEEVGICTEPPAVINDLIQRHVGAVNIQDAETVEARCGKIVHFTAYEFMAVPDNRPMARDNLFILMTFTKLG